MKVNDWFNVAANKMQSDVIKDLSKTNQEVERRKKMKNREWLNSLSNEEFTEWLYSDYRVMTTTNKNYETTWVKPPKSYSPTLKEILYCWHIPKQRLKEWLEEERENYEKEFIISDTTTSM